MRAVPLRSLDADERRFWQRWVLALLVAGLAVGGISQGVTIGIALSRVAGTNVTAFLTWRNLIIGPLLALVALVLGVAQWRAMRLLLPAVSRWWIVASLVGPLVALAIMTTDRAYRTLPDLLSMTQFFLGYLSQVSGPSVYRVGAYERTLMSLLPMVCFCGIVAAFQAFVLKGLVPHAGWWIGVALLAALAGVGTAQIGGLVRIEGYRLAPEIVRLDLLAINVLITVVQFGASCAVYGIVSGFGLVALRRSGRPTPLQAIATA